MKRKFDLYEETRLCFELGSAEYIDDDKNWGDDTDIICEYIRSLRKQKKRSLKVLYAGVGPGVLLKKLLLYNGFFNSIVGIDYAISMLKVCENEISNLETRKKITLVNADMQNLENLFAEESFDVILCLNNTFGNIPSRNGTNRAEDVRLSLLKTFNKLLEPCGLVFLSVYNANKLSLNTYYTGNLKINKRFSKGSDLVLEFVKSENHPHLYSHWFKDQEVEHLVERASFSMRYLTHHKKRIILVAEK